VHLLTSAPRWWGGRAVEGWGSACGIRGRRGRWHPPTRPAAIHSRLGRRERARAGNRGSASNARQSRALKDRGHAASLAEPRLENWQTRQHLCVFRIAFHLLNSTPRWWGGRAVEGTSLENWQTRQGLEGSNPSTTVCRAACEPGGSRRLLKRRASLSLRSIDDLSSAQIKVFTLPKEERIPPPPFRALATCFATCSLWCLLVLAATTQTACIALAALDR